MFSFAFCQLPALFASPICNWNRVRVRVRVRVDSCLFPLWMGPIIHLSCRCFPSMNKKDLHGYFQKGMRKMMQHEEEGFAVDDYSALTQSGAGIW